MTIGGAQTMRAGIAVVGLLLLSCSRSAPVPAPPPQTHTIVIEGMRFEPADLTVHPGDTIVWMNKDLFAHTATAEGGFDSRQIDPGGSWRLTLETAGDVSYVCTLHPTMKAILRVRGQTGV
jgi:plastocyanin